MSAKHQDPRWVRVRAAVKPRLLAALPSPCPRCGGIMARGMRLDLGHASLSPMLAFEASNLRLEHRSCNRRDGQRITTAMRRGKSNKERMPKW